MNPRQDSTAGFRVGMTPRGQAQVDAEPSLRPSHALLGTSDSTRNRGEGTLKSKPGSAWQVLSVFNWKKNVGSEGGEGVSAYYSTRTRGPCSCPVVRLRKTLVAPPALSGAYSLFLVLWVCVYGIDLRIYLTHSQTDALA